MVEETQNNNGHITGENPIILPTPVAVVRPTESRFTILTRFFSWLTGLTLAISVLVALITVAKDRNDLRTQFTCRAIASVGVNQALVDEQIAVARHNVSVGEFITIIIRTPPDDPARQEALDHLAGTIDEIDNSLTAIGVKLEEAVNKQQVALTSC